MKYWPLADRLWKPMNRRERSLANPEPLAPPPPYCTPLTSTEVIQIELDINITIATPTL
jgi:hypothetical protein